MDLPPDPGARHLAEQEARGSLLLFGASAFRPWLFNAFERGGFFGFNRYA